MNKDKKEQILQECAWYEEPRDYDYSFLKIAVWQKNEFGFIESVAEYLYQIQAYEYGRCFKNLTGYIESIIQYHEKQTKNDFDVVIYKDIR